MEQTLYVSLAAKHINCLALYQKKKRLSIPVLINWDPLSSGSGQWEAPKGSLWVFKIFKNTLKPFLPPFYQAILSKFQCISSPCFFSSTGDNSFSLMLAFRYSTIPC